MFSKGETDRIIAAIDAFAWKNSWHLPKDDYGFTDWRNPETLEKCLEVIQSHRKSSLKFAFQCDELADVITKGQQRLAEIEAEYEESVDDDYGEPM